MENPVTWDGLVDAVLRPAPDRGDDARNVEASYLMRKNLLNKTGIEFHWPGYQYMGPGTHLKKRLARGDPGINRLDRIAKVHDMDYDKAKNLKDKWAADRKMIAKIDQLPGSKNLTERIVRRIMKAKLRLGM